MSLSASADNPTFAHREIRNGAPIPPPIDDEDEKPSRHKRIGRKGLTAAIAAAVVFVMLGGAAAGGMSDDLPRELWSWIRATLITVIVIGLVVAGFGYGVEGANKREERSRTAIALLSDEIEVVREKVDAHGHNVLLDHTALHRDALKNQKEIGQVHEQIGMITEALARVLAFQEQTGHLFTECREHIGDLRQQVADLSLDYGKQLEELKGAMTGLGADLAAERLEGIFIEAFRKAYTNGYIDALDGRPPQAPPGPDNVRRLPGPDQR